MQEVLSAAGVSVLAFCFGFCVSPSPRTARRVTTGRCPYRVAVLVAAAASASRFMWPPRAGFPLKYKPDFGPTVFSSAQSPLPLVNPHADELVEFLLHILGDANSEMNLKDSSALVSYEQLPFFYVREWCDFVVVREIGQTAFGTIRSDRLAGYAAVRPETRSRA